MVLTCVFSAAGFIVVAAAEYESQAIIGVVFTSFSSGKFNIFFLCELKYLLNVFRILMIQSFVFE